MQACAGSRKEKAGNDTCPQSIEEGRQGRLAGMANTMSSQTLGRQIGIESSFHLNH